MENQFELKSEDRAVVEEVLEKIASQNNIDGVKGIDIILTKEAGVVQFKIADEVTPPIVSPTDPSKEVQPLASNTQAPVTEGPTDPTVSNDQLAANRPNYSGDPTKTIKDNVARLLSSGIKDYGREMRQADSEKMKDKQAISWGEDVLPAVGKAVTHNPLIGIPGGITTEALNSDLGQKAVGLGKDALGGLQNLGSSAVEGVKNFFGGEQAAAGNAPIDASEATSSFTAGADEDPFSAEAAAAGYQTIRDEEGNFLYSKDGVNYTTDTDVLFPEAAAQKKQQAQGTVPSTPGQAAGMQTPTSEGGPSAAGNIVPGAGPGSFVGQGNMRVKSPDGTTYEMPEAEAKDAIANQGYTQV